MLNKELRSLNHHYFEVNKKFEALFRRYMQKYGRTKVSSSDQNTFAQLVKDRKQVDYSAQVNGSLGNPFIRFMRLHFNTIKSEELNFYTELKNIKDKAAKSSNLGFTKGIDFRSEDEDDDELMSSEHSSHEGSAKPSRSSNAKKKHLPDSDHSPIKDSPEKPAPAERKAPPAKQPPNPQPTTNQKLLTTDPRAGEEPDPHRGDMPSPKPQTPASSEPLVEKIRIERTKSSDEED